MADTPLKIALSDLRLSDPPEAEGQFEGLQFDLGNLCVADTRPFKAEWFAGDVTQRVAERAGEAVHALFLKLSQLPRPDSTSVISLPPPSTLLPRSKPMPTAKPPTRWEAFARSKGIKKKKKRDKRVWDEATGEWRRRYGPKRVNDQKEIIVIDAKATDKPGESPFEKMEASKKDRVEKQKQRELRNAQRASKKGHRLPSTVQLVANLPKHGKGHPTERKNLREGIEKASKMAGLSTASMGKFDPKKKGEDADARISTRKKRSLVSHHDLGEKKFLERMSEKLVKERPEDVLNVDKAMGRLEADQRRQRHQEKLDDALDTSKKPRSQRKTPRHKRNAPTPLPKLKVTSRDKKLKKRRKRTH